MLVSPQEKMKNHFNDLVNTIKNRIEYAINHNQFMYEAQAEISEKEYKILEEYNLLDECFKEYKDMGYDVHIWTMYNHDIKRFDGTVYIEWRRIVINWKKCFLKKYEFKYVFTSMRFDHRLETEIIKEVNLAEAKKKAKDIIENLKKNGITVNQVMDVIELNEISEDNI